MTTLALGIDIGTTRCKVGLFSEIGTPLYIRSRATPMAQRAGECEQYEPEAVWNTICDLTRSAASACEPGAITCIGIASMSESGLIVDRRTGQARSPILPWFDRTTAPQAAFISEQDSEASLFYRFGTYPSFKCSLSKLLWLRATQPELFDENALWLTAAGYIAYRLSGAFSIDYSLACRTLAYDISRRAWDTHWLRLFELPEGIFPEVQPAGTNIGTVSKGAEGESGIPAGGAVVIAGHDHVCAAAAMLTGKPQHALDSMGTAEVLIGNCENAELGEEEYRSGLTFGLMPDGASMYWIGGLSSSGASIEWLRNLLGRPPLSYKELQDLLSGSSESPGAIMYLPYLSGSGPPIRNQEARAAFINLSASHDRADFVRAVLEGTAYQMQAMRSLAERTMGESITAVTAVGGGTKFEQWLQIKADVYGIPVSVPIHSEATLFGAALFAGVGCGMFPGVNEGAVAMKGGTAYVPNKSRHEAYTEKFHREFLLYHQFISERGR